jgi:hypothetical protein
MIVAMAPLAFVSITTLAAGVLRVRDNLWMAIRAGSRLLG